MEITLLITAIISFVIPAMVIRHFVKEDKASQPSKKKDFFIILIGLIHLIFAIILLLWSINIFEFNQVDFMIIFATIILIQTISLISILYQSVQNKKIFYSLLPFVFLIPFIFLKLSYLHLIIPVSLFATLLSFLIFADERQKTVKYITLYSSITLFAYLLSLLWENMLPFLGLISTTLFLIFLISFFNSLRTNPGQEAFPPHKLDSPIIHFLKHFIFIIIITNFIFIGTVSIHELGHLALAKSTNCQDAKIVYELDGFPHTEINCQNNSKRIQWILGGMLLPFFVALLFFMGGGIHMKEIALQIVGFNLVISYLDIISLGLSETIATFAFVFGIAFSILGLALLVRARVE